MIESDDDLWSKMQHVAGQAIRNYAQGILAEEVLIEQILQEWQRQRKKDGSPPQNLLTRLAQRVCSRALCAAWRSSRLEIRNRAFENLRSYLARSLHNSSYGMLLQQYAHASEDVLHETLEELHLVLRRNPMAGPDDPAAFLKWTQTILIRQAHLFVEKRKRDNWDSLDAQPDMFAEQYVDRHNPDPQEYVVNQELQQVVKDAILSLRNQRYQQVLLYTFLGGMAESELATHLHVDVQEIYLRKCRAIKALRNNPQVMQRLRSLRE